MLSLGSAQEVIEAQIKSGNVKFDLAGFLQNVVIADIPSPGRRNVRVDFLPICTVWGVGL